MYIKYHSQVSINFVFLATFAQDQSKMTNKIKYLIFLLLSLKFAKYHWNATALS